MSFLVYTIKITLSNNIFDKISCKICIPSGTLYINFRKLQQYKSMRFLRLNMSLPSALILNGSVVQTANLIVNSDFKQLKKNCAGNLVNFRLLMLNAKQLSKGEIT